MQVADSLQGVTAQSRPDTVHLVVPSNVVVRDTAFRKRQNMRDSRVQLDTIDMQIVSSLEPFARFGPSLQSVSFTGMPGIPSCCPEYNATWGWEAAAGIQYIRRLSRAFSWSAGTELGSQWTTFRADEPTTILDRGVPVRTYINHELSTVFTTVGGMFGFRYAPFSPLLISAGVGLDVQLWSTYSQYESLSSAGDFAKYLDTRSTQRNVFEGEIVARSTIRPRLDLSVSAELGLDSTRRVRLIPQLAYIYRPTTPVDGVTWSSHSIQLGLSISVTGQDEYLATLTVDSVAVVLPDSIEQRPPYIGSFGEIPTSGVQRFVHVTHRTEPLLPYVFFEEGASEIPQRYVSLSRSQSQAVNDASALVSNQPLSSYYNLLNIVGLRMRSMPATKIKLIGCNQDVRGEHNLMALSRQRAMRVRDYLHTVWGVDTSRIEVAGRDLPERASVYRMEADNLDANGENRRVELSSESPGLLSDITASSETWRIDPDSLRVLIVVDKDSDPMISDVRLSVYGRSHVVDQATKYQRIGDTIVLRIPTAMLSGSYRSDDTLTVSVTLKEKSGSVKQCSRSVRMNPHVNSTVENYLSLLLFNYGSTELDPRSVDILKDYAQGIDSSASVTIVGLTDRIGDDAVNKRLSLERATEVSAVLKLPKATVDGRGESSPVYNNDLPEGRFYNRTVQIIISTDK